MIDNSEATFNYKSLYGGFLLSLFSNLSLLKHGDWLLRFDFGRDLSLLLFG
jgi:hypothetical protein